jgi:hypothetical protein
LPAGAKTLQVIITGNKVNPAPTSIDLKTGQTLRLVITDNSDNVFHAHGFNKEVNLPAGKATTIDLVTNSPGKYEVETHHPELKLLTVLVR